MKTFGATVSNAEGGSDFFALNAKDFDEAMSSVEGHIEGNERYTHPLQIDIVYIEELLHQQFRGIATIGTI